MGKRIIDEFTNLPVSREQKRKLRAKRDGICLRCHGKAGEDPNCSACADLLRPKRRYIVVKDEFTDLPLSNQLKKRLRLERDGLCTKCGWEPGKNTRCSKCLNFFRELVPAQTQGTIAECNITVPESMAVFIVSCALPRPNLVEEERFNNLVKEGEALGHGYTDIVDEYSGLNIPESRKLELRLKRDGLCPSCGKQRGEGSPKCRKCLTFVVRITETYKRYRKNKKEK